MRIFLVIIFISMTLSAFTGGTVRTPGEGKFYVPLLLSYMENEAEDISIGFMPGLVYGFGDGFSLDFSFHHPFKEKVLSEDSYQLMVRKDFSFGRKSRFALMVEGGAGYIDLHEEEWYFPCRTGLVASFKRASFGAGATFLIDMIEQNAGTIWVGMEIPLGRNAALRAEYNHHILDDTFFKRMLFAGIVVGF